MSKNYFVPMTQEEDELYHHGILGMKWGVRRYQNADGSLTTAGKRRLAKDNYKLGNDSANQKYEKRMAKLASQGKGKNSVEAVKAKTERDNALKETYAKYRKDKNDIKLEKEQNKSVNKQVEVSEKGKDFAKAFLLTAGIMVASKLVNNAINKATGSDDAISKDATEKVKKKVEDQVKKNAAETVKDTVLKGEWLGNAAKESASTAFKKSQIIYDVDWEDVTNRGSNFTKGLLNSSSNLLGSGAISGSTSIAGLLPPPSSTSLIPK